MGRQTTVSVLAATRLHFPAGTTAIPEVTVENLRRFARSTQELGIAAAVAVNSLQALVEDILRESAPQLDFKVLHVPVWGAFVPALNTLLSEAQARGDHYILYQSLEVRCTRPVIKRLLDHFTRNTLVVGPVLDGHSFEDGERPLNGRTSPWNTLALWKVRKLALTGFLSIADGMPQSQARGGVQARRGSTTSTTWARHVSGENSEFTLDDHLADLSPDLPRGRQWSGDVLPEKQGRHAALSDVSDFYDADVHEVDESGETLGSEAWWTKKRGASENKKGGWLRQQSQADALAIPAGVEEVTAIALLQHVLGTNRARAVLVKLPDDLAGSVSWEAKWAGDDKRKAWHDYKMASKVTRPAAQIRQLFGPRRGYWQALGLPLLKPVQEALKMQRRPFVEPPLTPGGSGADDDLQHLNFGVVQQYSDSIPPPTKVELICFLSVVLFSANFAAIFASALQTVNNDGREAPEALLDVMWLGLEISAVYLPMPVSLWLTRWVVSAFDHRAGLVLFAMLTFISHCMVIVAEAHSKSESRGRWLLILSRLVAGLGSGVLFQARFVVASLSTMDHHRTFQARQLLASDLGLGFGALLPWVASVLSGSAELSVRRPEFGTSVALATLSLLLWLWILISFPTSVERLPDRIRFLALRDHRRTSNNALSVGAIASEQSSPRGFQTLTSGISIAPSVALPNDEFEAPPSDDFLSWRTRMLLSGTLRVFVQSAAVMAVALRMKDATSTESFGQTKVIGCLLLLTVPFEAVASGVCAMPGWTICLPLLSWLQEHGRFAAITIVWLVILTIAVTRAQGPASVEDASLVATGELWALLVALAVASPLNASRLYALKDAERSVVMLEWLKAYVGRILGPLFALVVSLWIGFDSLLVTLCAATVVVAVTA